jgi:hypothetical protein
MVSNVARIASVMKKYARLQGISPKLVIEMDTSEVKKNDYKNVAEAYNSGAVYFEIKGMRKLILKCRGWH